jgi:hypothetical protein
MMKRNSALVRSAKEERGAEREVLRVHSRRIAVRGSRSDYRSMVYI